jgi:L-aminopeptidase/D-esterase-like protein
VARAQSQYLRIYDIDTDVTLQRWQSYYANATVTFSSQQWAYVPFVAEGFTEGISGDESNITISAPATPIVVEAFETAIKRGHLVEIKTYQFDALLGNDAPQAAQQQIAVFVGQVTGGAGSLTTLTVQLGSAISPVGAQIPPRTFTTAMIGKGCKL